MAAWERRQHGSRRGGRDRQDQYCLRLSTQFQTVFGGEATPERIIRPSLLRTDHHSETALSTGGGPGTKRRWVRGQEGLQVFKKLECDNCHDGVLLADLQYHNVGIGMDAEKPDVGRFKVTGKAEDTGAFKTPTLRDIAKSGPYFHNGSVATLEEAVDLMIGGGKPNKYLDRKNLKKRKATGSPEEGPDYLFGVIEQ